MVVAGHVGGCVSGCVGHVSDCVSHIGWLCWLWLVMAGHLSCAWQIVKSMHNRQVEIAVEYQIGVLH